MRKRNKEVNHIGLFSLMGKRVLLMCANYFYAGKLTGFTDTEVLLEDPYIVYETGEWDDKKWAEAKPLGRPIFVNRDFIESFFEGK